MAFGHDSYKKESKIPTRIVKHVGVCYFVPSYFLFFARPTGISSHRDEQTPLA
jgi:hypothetical protein